MKERQISDLEETVKRLTKDLKKTEDDQLKIKKYEEKLKHSDKAH